MLSVVIPLFNEEESLHELYSRVKIAISSLSREYETIFIDDGSTDKSLDILKNLSKKDKTVRVFSFRRNQGKAEALTLGFQKAKGEYIVTLDADLQDRPEEIKKLLEKCKEGYDVVSGWRKNRKDAAKMKIISKFWNLLTGWVWGLKLHDYNCGLKVYRKEAAKTLRLYGGMHRFIPLIVSEQGFSVAELPVVHDSRKFGKSKYGFSKIKDIPDMFTMVFLTKYGTRPLHFFGVVGSIFLTSGIVIMIFFWILHTFFHQAVGDRPLLFIGMLMTLGGLQILFTGFLADLLLHISYQEQLVNNSSVATHLLKYSSDKL